MKNIKKAFEKFRSELLSKGFYDIFKALVIFLAGPLTTYLVSLVPSVKIFLIDDVKIPIYLIITLTAFVCSLFFLIISYKSKLNRLIIDNNIDETTGLKNHKALKISLESFINDFKDNVSVILIDIDDFKSFNTKYGYGEADLILAKIGKLLGSDKRATDDTFRFFQRGDEFLVIAKETNIGQAFQAAERKRKLIGNNIFLIGNSKHSLTVSCGVTTLKREDSIDSITERVSEAMKEAKNVKGKNNTKSIS